MLIIYRKHSEGFIQLILAILLGFLPCGCQTFNQNEFDEQGILDSLESKRSFFSMDRDSVMIFDVKDLKSGAYLGEEVWVYDRDDMFLGDLYFVYSIYRRYSKDTSVHERKFIVNDNAVIENFDTHKIPILEKHFALSAQDEQVRQRTSPNGNRPYQVTLFAPGEYIWHDNEYLFTIKSRIDSFPPVGTLSPFYLRRSTYYFNQIIGPVQIIDSLRIIDNQMQVPEVLSKTRRY